MSYGHIGGEQTSPANRADMLMKGLFFIALAEDIQTPERGPVISIQLLSNVP